MSDKLVPWGLYYSGWFLLSLIFALCPEQADVWSFGPELWSTVVHWLIWGYLGPWIFRAVNYAGNRSSRVQRVLGNVAFGLAFIALFRALDYIQTGVITGVFQAGLTEGLARDVLTYLCIATAIHAYRYQDRSKGLAIQTSALEAQLAQARLQALKAQLHPHFLFNTLNAISALMHRDVDSADRMIALLSDLLRISLDRDERHQVSLKDELAFLERYLAIERIRFRDRLTVEIDVEPGCGSVLVPRLILQPLVENSIIHGVALHSTAGLISIKARRKGNRLSVSVADDGPGLIDDKPSREGVGLSNTRARLAELYGSDHRFALTRAAEGGLEVTLEMPFEHTPRFPLDEEASES